MKWPNLTGGRLPKANWPRRAWALLLLTLERIEAKRLVNRKWTRHATRGSQPLFELLSGVRRPRALRRGVGRFGKSSRNTTTLNSALHFGSTCQSRVLCKNHMLWSVIVSKSLAKLDAGNEHPSDYISKMLEMLFPVKKPGTDVPGSFVMDAMSLFCTYE